MKMTWDSTNFLMSFAMCAFGWPYRLADTVGVAVFEASLVVRRTSIGTWSSDGCSTLVGCLGRKHTPVLIWPSILIDWLLSCHALGPVGVCMDRLSVTSSCVRSNDSNLTSGKNRLLDGRMNVGMASGSFRSLASAVAEFVMCIEFDPVGILV